MILDLIMNRWRKPEPLNAIVRILRARRIIFLASRNGSLPRRTEPLQPSSASPQPFTDPRYHGENIPGFIRDRKLIAEWPTNRDDQFSKLISETGTECDQMIIQYVPSFSPILYIVGGCERPQVVFANVRFAGENASQIVSFEGLNKQCMRYLGTNSPAREKVAYL